MFELSTYVVAPRIVPYKRASTGMLLYVWHVALEILAPHIWRYQHFRSFPLSELTSRTVALRGRGFTLIELLIVIAILAILAAVAYPSYTAYLYRARIPPGLDALSAFSTRMEQRYQDAGTYAWESACALTVPPIANFTFECKVSDQGQGFKVTAKGTGTVAGVEYSVDDKGTRLTVSHPQGAPSQNCWTLRGSVCDY